MFSKSAAALQILLSIASVAQAKQWVMTPLARGARFHGAAAMAQSQGLKHKGGIEALGSESFEGEAKPSTPQGFVVEEIREVRMASNDPLYAQQWNLEKVMAPRGWARAAQAGDPVVAVVDTGIDGGHPDLAGRVIGGANFVDDGSGAALPHGSWNDDHSHGTFCASLVAAGRDDGIGMAGMDGGVKLLAVKVLDYRGYGTDYGVAQGMVWAVDQGARVLSVSLGMGAASAVLQAAVDYATSHNVLVVAASGNSGDGTLIYPAAGDGVLSVGSSNRNDERASYSTYNARLSMVAPGGDASADVLGAVPGGGYSHGSGTSFAAPQVAGAAALYLALHPAATAQQAFAALTSTADPIDMAGGKSPSTGWGRLNVARLLGEDVEPNVFGAGTGSSSLPFNGAPITALVGAGEPAAPAPVNPDPSHVQTVWAVITQSGAEISRKALTSMGGNDWTAQVTVPLWLGSQPRSLTLDYQAVDSTGHISPLIPSLSIVQAAGSVLPNFSHTAPQSLPAGQNASFTLTQSPARPAFRGWTIHYRTRGGQWKSAPGGVVAEGSIRFDVPAADVQEAAIEYYFSALDQGGEAFFVRDSASPYAAAVLGEHLALQLKYLANPSPDLCLRLVSPEQGSASLDFYSLSGERVGGLRQDVVKGENRLCLDQVVASGVYFCRARIEGQKGMVQLKMAVKH